MKLVFSSKEYPEARRFEAWREGVCERYVVVDMVNRRVGDHIGHIKEAKFGPVTLTDAQAPPQHIIRRSTHLSKVDKDCFYVQFALHGAQEVEQEGRHTTCEPGKAGLFWASHPYELRNVVPSRSIFVEFTTEEFRKRFDGKVLPRTSVLHTGFGIGRVAAAMCSSMAAESEHLSDTAKEGLGSQILNVLSLAFQSTESDPSQSWFDPDIRSFRLQQIMRYIEKNVCDQLLNPSRIARANQMSVRSLHYLFKSAEMSVSDFIWTTRLERCRRELEFDVALNRTVTDIAMDAGFNSLSHFSSVFRKRYGVSPSDVRGSARPKV